MAIECIFKIENKTITIDLEEFLGDVDALVNEIYEKIGREIPIDFDNNEVKIQDTDYFNALDDVKKFIDISFDDDDHAHIFLEWREHNGYAFDDYETFKDAYRGTYSDTKEFCEENTDECGQLEHVPEYIKSCIDWERVWESTMRFQYLDLKVENGEAFGTTLYSVAIFSRI